MVHSYVLCSLYPKCGLAGDIVPRILSNLSFKSVPFYPNVRVFAIAKPSVVCNVRAPLRPTQGIETFGNISSPFCTLAIIRPPCKILRRSSKGNLSAGR